MICITDFYNMKATRYFTLEDVKNCFETLNQYSGPFAMEVAKEKMSAFMSKAIQNRGWNGPTIPSSTYMDICWQQYIYPKFFNLNICMTDDDTIGDNDADKVFSNKVGEIVAWMRASDDKFTILIKNQVENKNKLLQQIKSSSTNRFNDTPQNSGAFGDSTHNTTVTTIENSTDGSTLLSRLNEIEDNLKRLYENWSNEFRKFIIWSE